MADPENPNPKKPNDNQGSVLVEIHVGFILGCMSHT